MIIGMREINRRIRVIEQERAAELLRGVLTHVCPVDARWLLSLPMSAPGDDGDWDFARFSPAQTSRAKSIFSAAIAAARQGASA